MDHDKDVVAGDDAAGIETELSIYPAVRAEFAKSGPCGVHLGKEWVRILYSILAVFLLLISYFLGQYDKFVVSYFQAEIVSDLSISAAGYGALTGYGTSVLSSFTALPIALFTDYSSSRVWALTVLIIWWSLMVIFQGLAKEFWQMVCARLGMFFGQSASEAIAVSLISDLIPPRYIPIAESLLYTGVYIGEAISARLAAIFHQEGKSWRVAFKGIGVTGMIVAVMTRFLLVEPANTRRIWLEGVGMSREDLPDPVGSGNDWRSLRVARSEVWQSLRYCMALESFWILTLSAAMRQLGGNVFGYYMPTYLQLEFPTHVAYLVTTYGTIVGTYLLVSSYKGTVGSCTALFGGFITAIFSRRNPLIPLQITAYGGLLSIPFVLLVVFSPLTDRPFATLFTALCFAYMTAELWLGSMASVILGLLPIRYKTLGYAIYGLVNLLVYSSGPELVAIAQYKAGVSTEEPGTYIVVTRIVLAVMIPFGYAAAAFGLIAAQQRYLRDLARVREEVTAARVKVQLSRATKVGFIGGMTVLGMLVVGLTITSYILGT